MKGKANRYREAMVRIRVFGNGNRSRSIWAVVDTGYSGSLTLPPRMVRSLKLALQGQSDVELGDGSLVTFNFFSGNVSWLGKQKSIEIDEADTDPLVGMKLLNGSKLAINVKPGGDVIISPLP